MKRRIITYITFALLSSSLLSGCASTVVNTDTHEDVQSETQSTPQTTEQSENIPDDSVDTANTSIDNSSILSVFSELSSFSTVMSYSKVDYFEGDPMAEAEEYITDYEIYLKNNEAVIIESSNSSETRKNIVYYAGNVSKENNILTIICKENPNSTSDITFCITLDSDNNIIDFEEFFTDDLVLQSVGTYTGVDDDYGDLTLVINNAGTATLTTNKGLVFDGTIANINNKLDLMVSNEATDQSLDWYIYINDTSFDHEQYYYEDTIDYSVYEGTYYCVGSLGDFDLHVNAYGDAYADIYINGEVHYCSGSINIDYDTGDLCGAYLLTDDDYSMNIDLVYFEDEEFWNYSGYLSCPLSAG